MMSTARQLPLSLFLACFAFACSKNAPVTKAPKPPVVYQLLQKPGALLEAGQYDSAIFYYKKAAERYWNEEKNTDGYIRAILHLSEACLSHGKFQNAIDELQQLNPFVKDANAKKDYAAQYFYLLGMAFNRLDNADSSEYYHLKSLEIREVLYPNPHWDKVDSYMELGNVYSYMLHDYGSGQRYFEYALRELKELDDSTQLKTTFLCYYNLAANNRNRKSLNKAEYYAKGAYEVAARSKKPNLLKYAHNLLAAIYESRSDYRSSIGHYRKCIAFAKLDTPVNYHHILINYNNLAINLRKSQNTDSSIIISKRALDLMDELELEMLPLKMEILANLGFTYHKQGSESAALVLLRRSVDISKRLHDGFSKKYLPYHFLASYYKENKNFDLSIENYNQALKILTKSSAISDARITDYLTTYSILFALAQTYKLKSDQGDFSNTLYLAKALNNYLLADSLLQIHKKSNFLESDEVWLSDEIQKHYDDALECVKSLYLENPSSKLIHTGFELIEQNKARVLSKSIKKVETLAEAGVSDSLIQYWNDLQQQIAFYQKQYGSQQSDAGAKLLELIQKETFLDHYFREQFSSYLKYRLQPVSARFDSIQKYVKSNKIAVVSYYKGHSQITALSLRPDSSFLYFIPVDDTLANCLADFRKTLSRGMPASKNEFKKYVNVSHSIYRSLIAPAIAGLKNEDVQRLKIIGDRALTTLPFEALISEYPDTSRIDYKALDYLVKKYEISYSYSISSVLEEKQATNEPEVMSFGGWSYDQLNDSALSKIAQANNELKAVSAIFDSRLYLNEDAKETNFKRDAGSYDILHLSVHGASSISGMPGMFFNEDEENDGRLYPYELYSLKLRAKMTVLSACETGLGAIHPGEGVFSIARGFIYAGCPSIVINLWKAKDRAAKDVQVMFYHNLAEGVSKSKALQQSKIDYLNKSDRFTAHPSFWASSVLVGSTKALAIAKSGWDAKRISIAAIVLIVAILIVAYKSSKRIRSKIAGKAPR